MVNGTQAIYIEKGGKLHETEAHFESEDHIMRVIQGLCEPLGRTINEVTPIVDARLPDGSRINAVVRPIALTGPTLTIRKFPARTLTVEDLIGLGAWSEKVVEFLQQAIQARVNMVVSGGTSSGKTTVFNLLSRFFDDNERVVTVETAAELQLQHKHVIALESRPPNRDGTGEITMADLIMNASRMRPDRIIGGEVRSGEVWDMLQVMTQGFDGSMFTIHAVDVPDVLDRIEMMCIASVSLPVLQIRAKIAQGINLITHQDRLPDGTRRITRISEVVGLKNNIIETRDIMRYMPTGSDNGRTVGEFRFTGVIPTFANRLELPENFFAS